MAKFESRNYRELGFFVNGEYRRFNGHYYVTVDAAEIAVLDRITDCVRVDEEKPEEPAAKAPTTRKASAKPSAE